MRSITRGANDRRRTLVLHWHKPAGSSRPRAFARLLRTECKRSGVKCTLKRDHPSWTHGCLSRHALAQLKTLIRYPQWRPGRRPTWGLKCRCNERCNSESACAGRVSISRHTPLFPLAGFEAGHGVYYDAVLLRSLYVAEGDQDGKSIVMAASNNKLVWTFMPSVK